MIEFKANGWDFETSEDVCYALEEICKQLRDGYRSGYLGNLSWDISGEEERDIEGDYMCTCSDAYDPHYHCLDCDCVLKNTDTLDPHLRICNSCASQKVK